MTGRKASHSAREHRFDAFADRQVVANGIKLNGRILCDAEHLAIDLLAGFPVEKCAMDAARLVVYDVPKQDTPCPGGRVKASKYSEP